MKIEDVNLDDVLELLKHSPWFFEDYCRKAFVQYHIDYPQQDGE